MPIKLKPVVYSTNRYATGTQNTTQQMFLLKALQVTQDPKKLRDMIGVKTVADVYRTLDKMAMRKEYHAALERSGVTFDFMVTGIKNIALTGEHDGDRLKAYQALLKSVGMEKYDDSVVAQSGTWEEVLLKKIEEGKKDGAVALPAGPAAPYEVVHPKLPESVRLQQLDEEEMTSSIYDSQK